MRGRLGLGPSIRSDRGQQFQRHDSRLAKEAITICGHDPNGNRINLRKRDSAAYAYGDIVYEFDAFNRVTRKTVPERAAPHPAPLAAAQTRDVF
jgi:hypothetical protein